MDTSEDYYNYILEEARHQDDDLEQFCHDSSVNLFVFLDAQERLEQIRQLRGT